MSSQQLDEERIFHVARVISDAAMRSEYLDQICAGDQNLRERVEALLEVHENEQAFLKSDPDAAPTVDHTPLSEHPGSTIGRYHLREQIGEGGMGTVFVAEQERPIRRKVALKVIKPGMDSKAVVARFEAERQALALMDHPNIAKVLDAGTTDSGRPYFVMELVRGIPITEYCDEHKLTIRERLELFTQVCQAIQHAHQKAIIHRDIKPTNVLVTEQDGKAVPKVIDFGVAKALNQRLTERTVYTSFAQVIGTPLYMSPEQASLSAVDVDTRSDVYSLGVLLYELLTGTTPFEQSKLEEAAQHEVLRIIREEEPPRPSNRISTLGKTASRVSQLRQTHPDRLGHLVKGDLDWIVMTALAKERARRYESASRLAEDVRRHLKNDAVEARPPSTWYELQKLYQRNQALATGVGVAVLALTLGLSAAVWGLIQVAATNKELQNERDAQRELSKTLREKNDELANALRDWRHVLIERGIEAALRGDVPASREVADKARMAQAPEAWVLLIEGLAYQHAGDTTLARDKLTRASQLAPDSLGIASALTMAAIGDQGVFIKANDESIAAGLYGNLDKLTPSEEFRKYDLLFRGWTQVYEDPKEAIETIHKVVDEHYPWPFVQAMLAMCQVHVASDTGDPQDAIRALDTIRRCEGQLPDNAFVMFVGIHCRLWACLLAEDQIDLPTIVAETEELANGLRQRPSGWAADSRAAYFELVGHPNTYQEYETVRNDWWQSMRAAVMLRSDQTWPRENAIANPEDSPFRAIGEACALSLTGDGPAARRSYERLSRSSSPIIRTLSLEILLYLKDSQQVQETSKALAAELDDDANVFDPPFWFLRERLRYLDGEASPDEFLGNVHDSLRGRCVANYLIALTHRAQDDRPKAREHFLACVRTKQFWMWQYHFSRTILELEFGAELDPAISP